MNLCGEFGDIEIESSILGLGCASNNSAVLNYQVDSIRRHRRTKTV